VTAVNDDDLIADDEILVSAPLRIDFDERRGHVHNAHTRRHNGPDAQREVDVVHARYVAAGEDGLLDPRALLRAERHVATSLTLGSLTLGLALLRLTRLALLALRSLACGLILLTTLALSLLALRGLPGRLIPLRLTALALALLVLSVLVLSLADVGFGSLATGEIEGARLCISALPPKADIRSARECMRGALAPDAKISTRHWFGIQRIEDAAQPATQGGGGGPARLGSTR
jgi:hypothetical protein